jgi:hypothetical protein
MTDQKEIESILYKQSECLVNLTKTLNNTTNLLETLLKTILQNVNNEEETE